MANNKYDVSVIETKDGTLIATVVLDKLLVHTQPITIQKNKQ